MRRRIPRIPEDVYKRARVFDGYVDAINATDGSGANCHMSSLAVCALLTRVGYAPIMQISCRDKNRIAIQGDILGGAAMGVCNMLCLTGDGVQAGDHPQAKPVFDLDCVSLLDIARTLRDDHHFQSGRKISFAPRVFFGAAENPSALPHAWRAQRLAKKVAAGAQFIQTQYCYDMPLLRGFMEQVEALGLFGKVFISWSVSARCARRRPPNGCARTFPACTCPTALIARLAGAQDQAREGRNICIELIQAIREMRGISGVHIMAYRQEESVAEIVDRSGVLQGRAPWYPGRDDLTIFSQDSIMTDTVISSATKEVVIGFNRPFVIIGERINPTGRKILAAEMAAGDFSRVEADARAQVEAGAHMLDVNAGHSAGR